MLIKRILAYFKAKKEQRDHDRRPFYYPGDGTVEDRRNRMVEKRMKEYDEARMTYHRQDSRKIALYLDGLWQRVQDAKAIETYEDWEREMMRMDLEPPRVIKILNRRNRVSARKVVKKHV